MTDQRADVDQLVELGFYGLAGHTNNPADLLDECRTADELGLGSVFISERFNLKERGYLREGYWADLTLVDLDRAATVRKEDVLYKCGWSPVEGMTFPASIDATWVNGELAYKDGKVLPKPLGQRIQFR